MKVSAALLPLITLLATSAFAQPSTAMNPLEKNKAKIVSRLYQATYGASERCQKAPAQAAAEFQSELNRFVGNHGRLMQQLVDSPYYDDARKQFSKHARVDLQQDTPEKLGGECQSLAQLLRSMNDTPEGKKAVQQYEDTLSK